jgi:hypothetical protein
VEGAGVPVDRRAACLDMPDNKELLDPLLDVEVACVIELLLQKKMNPCEEQAFYAALDLAFV